DLIFSLSALLLSRYLRRHAPPGLARELGPWLPRMLWLVAMSGFGLILSELLALLQSTPFRTEGGSIWQFVHAVWLLAAITAVFVGNYRVAVHYLRTTDARTAAGSGGGS
ncbi:MAG TPA: hypothetical protein VMU54_22770, partial [Planctomycetota bacterium]|nr:hypothetical protein [Planctomycetota bacterium]